MITLHCKNPRCAATREELVYLGLGEQRYDNKDARIFKMWRCNLCGQYMTSQYSKLPVAPDVWAYSIPGCFVLAWKDELDGIKHIEPDY